MGEVKSITGAPIGQREVNEKCVDTLRELLEMAESGEIVAVSAAYLYYDGLGSFAFSGGHISTNLIGAANLAAAKLTNAVLEDL